MEDRNIGAAPAGYSWNAWKKLARCIRFTPLLAALLFTAPSGADTLQGRVVAVTDGDTVKVLDASNTQWKIRLMGIDAPEKKQAFGARSKSNLSDLIFGKTVVVEYSKKDKYGRTVGKILVNGVDANLEQIKAGMAWHYKKYAKEQAIEDRETYAQAEEQARAGQRGLWSEAEPVPPWDWRQSKKR
ncbi:MAG: thermonuclease family protein [Sideroxyarcus sp.]